MPGPLRERELEEELGQCNEWGSSSDPMHCLIRGDWLGHAARNVDQGRSSTCLLINAKESS
jgi:hypothetical protein